MGEMCFEVHKSGNGYTKIVTRLKMPISTIRAILCISLKQLELLQTCVEGHPLFSAPTHSEEDDKRGKKITVGRTTEESGILGSSNLPVTSMLTNYLEGMPEKLLPCHFTTNVSTRRLLTKRYWNHVLWSDETKNQHSRWVCCKKQNAYTKSNLYVSMWEVEALLCCGLFFLQRPWETW